MQRCVERRRETRRRRRRSSRRKIVDAFFRRSSKRVENHRAGSSATEDTPRYCYLWMTLRYRSSRNFGTIFFKALIEFEGSKIDEIGRGKEKSFLDLLGLYCFRTSSFVYVRKGRGSLRSKSVWSEEANKREARRGPRAPGSWEPPTFFSAIGERIARSYRRRRRRRDPGLQSELIIACRNSAAEAPPVPRLFLFLFFFFGFFFFFFFGLYNSLAGFRRHVFASSFLHYFLSVIRSSTVAIVFM